jgi:hypothetical protein
MRLKPEQDSKGYGMARIAIIMVKLGSGLALIAFGTLAAGAGLLQSNNLLLLASGAQFLGGLALVIASASNLTNQKVVNLDDPHPGVNRSTDRISIARWAELATSQTDAWMNAIGSHETGRYEDACFHYFVDALNSSATGEYGKASLSLDLATDCLELIGHKALASRTAELAQIFYIGTKIESLPKSKTPLLSGSEREHGQSATRFSFRRT